MPTERKVLTPEPTEDKQLYTHRSHDGARVLLCDDIVAAPRRRPDRRLLWPDYRRLRWPHPTAGAVSMARAAACRLGRRRRRRRLAALALLLRWTLPWPTRANHGVRIRIRVWHQLVLSFRLFRLLLRFLLWLATVVAVTFHCRLGLGFLGLGRLATRLFLARRFAWLGCRWHRPDLGDDDLLHDLAGLGPDFLAELLRVEFPAHHHLVALVFELYLLDAKLLCFMQKKTCLLMHAKIRNSEFSLVS